MSAVDRTGIPVLLAELTRALPEGYGAESITGRLVKDGDVVMLVMPQDSEAPKGRLILPQVQTIRDLANKSPYFINDARHDGRAHCPPKRAPDSSIPAALKRSP